MTSIQLKRPNNVVDQNRAFPGRNRACTTGDILRAVLLVALLVAAGSMLAIPTAFQRLIDHGFSPGVHQTATGSKDHCMAVGRI